MITLERWKTISLREQLGHIASEILRAGQAQDKELRRAILECALYLIDLSLEDPKWHKNIYQLLTLRNEVAEAYVDENKNLERVYAIL